MRRWPLITKIFSLWFVITLIFVLSCTHRAYTSSKNSLSSEEIDQERINRAQTLHDMGEIAAAISILRTWVDQTAYRPQHNRAYELIVEWLLQINQQEEAKRVASYFLAHHQHSPSAKKIVDLFKVVSSPQQPSGLKPTEETPLIEEKSNNEAPDQSLDLDNSVSGVANLRENTSLALYHFHVGNLDQSEELLAKAPTIPNSKLNVPLLRKEIAEIKQVDLKSFAILLPLTGSYKAFGKNILTAVSLALNMQLSGLSQEINWIQKDGIKIAIADSKSDAAFASAMVDNLIKEHHVAMVIGEITNEASLRMAQKCQQYGVPMLSLSRHPLIADLGSSIHVFNSSPQQQVSQLVEHAMSSRGHKKFAILYPRHNYGITMAKMFFDEVNNKGGTITAIEAYYAHETNFLVPIKKLVGKHYLSLRPESALCPQKLKEGKYKSIEQCRQDIKPILDFDALFIPEFNKLAFVIPAIKQEGLLINDNPKAKTAFSMATKMDNPKAIQLLGSNSWNDKSTLDKIANEIDGAYFVDSVSFLDGDAKRFFDAFLQRSQFSPTTLEVFAHDATLLAMTMLKDPNKQGINTRKELNERLSAFVGKVGILDKISFSKNGELDAPTVGFLMVNAAPEIVHNKKQNS